MRFDSSAETSHSVAGGISAVLDHWIVGSDSSSATHGSSTARVAGKKRAPTKQWANACEEGRATNNNASANAREHHGLPGMIFLHRSMSDIAAASAAARHQAVSGGARERCDFVSRPAAARATAGSGDGRPAACGAPVTVTGGGGNAAI